MKELESVNQTGNLHKAYLSLYKWVKMFNLFLIVIVTGALVIGFRYNYTGYLVIGSVTIGIGFIFLGFGVFNLIKYKKYYKAVPDIPSRKIIKERYQKLFKLSFLVGKGWAVIGNFGKGMYIEDAGKKNFNDKNIVDYADIFYGDAPITRNGVNKIDNFSNKEK